MPLAPETEARLDAFRRALGWGDHFRLIFVSAPEGPARREILERILAWSGTDGVPAIYRVDLAAGARPVAALREVARAHEAEPRFGVVLLGIDQYARGEQATPEIEELNFARDELPDWLPGPLVIVARAETIAHLMAVAADLSSVRAFSLEVVGVEDLGPEIVRNMLWRDQGLIWNDPARAVVERLEPLYREMEARGAPAAELASVALRLGVALRRDHRSDEGLAHVERATSLYRAAGDLRGEAVSLEALGHLAFLRSDLEAARERYEQALATWQRVGDLHGRAECTALMAFLALWRSDFESARVGYEQALELYQRLGSASGVADTMSRLGDASALSSDLGRARAFYEQALKMYEGLGRARGKASVLTSIGHLDLRRSDVDAARSRYEAALQLYESMGELFGQAESMQHLGDLASVQSDKERARECYQAALAIFERLDEPEWIVRAHLRLAGMSEGDARRAHFRAAQEALSRSGRPRLVFEPWPEDELREPSR